MKLRVGLIGLGENWQTMHRPALRMLGERFDVRAIYCSVSKLAENAVAEFQADPVDGYQSIVNRDDIDAVLILERSWLRFLPAMAACRAGKSVYWAGDLDLDPIRDSDFRQCVVDSGVAFMAGLPRRFAPATLRLKELIATHLGPPRLLFCHKRLAMDHAPQRRLMGRREMGGRDLARDLGTREMGAKPQDEPQVGVDELRAFATRTELIELIDWCCYVVGGRPQSVVSANMDPSESADYQAFSLRFDPFITAQISCGSYIPARWQEAIGFRPPAAMQVCCERGVAFIDLPGTLVWFDDAGRHQESLDNEAPVGEKMLGQFHRAVTSLVRNLSGLEDAYLAASILKAARQSNNEGRRVEIEKYPEKGS